MHGWKIIPSLQYSSFASFWHKIKKWHNFRFTILKSSDFFNNTIVFLATNSKSMCGPLTFLFLAPTSNSQMPPSNVNSGTNAFPIGSTASNDQSFPQHWIPSLTLSIIGDKLTFAEKFLIDGKIFLCYILHFGLRKQFMIINHRLLSSPMIVNQWHSERINQLLVPLIFQS